MRASELLGRTAYAADGTPLGRVIDLLTQPDTDGQPRITHVVVSQRVRARLYGYEREGLQRPWVVEKLVSLVHRGITEVPIDQIHWSTEET